MRITDNELREKLLAHLGKVGEQSTISLMRFGETWAGASKIREILLSLKEEALVTSYKDGVNKTAPTMYKLAQPATRISDLPELEKSEVIEVLEALNPELNTALKQEYTLILKKQMRRRDKAGKVLQMSEAMIKHLEGKIKWL